MSRTQKFFAAIGGLFVLVIIIGAASGSHTSSTTTVTSATSSAAANVATSATSSAAANVVHHAKPRPKAKPKPQVFTGNSDENVGTVHVPTQSVLHWSVSCGSFCDTGPSSYNFVIGNNFNDDNQIDVNALGGADTGGKQSGQTVVDAGTYHDVQVTTEGGTWTFMITPGNSTQS